MFRVGTEYWLWQAGVGGLQVFADRPEFVAYRSADVGREWFERLVQRSWLPAVYQVWGRQVLHASAACRRDSATAVAFVGTTGAGKSTLAYALGRRPAWQQLSDDSLAFSRRGEAVSLHPLRNDVRLRPATVAHYGTNATDAVVEWPATPPRLKCLYFLAGQSDRPEPARLSRVSAAEAYRLVLAQAFAFSLVIPEHNRRLLQDYLALARIPACRLTYRMRFDVIEDVLDVIEEHCAGGFGIR